MTTDGQLPRRSPYAAKKLQMAVSLKDSEEPHFLGRWPNIVPKSQKKQRGVSETTN